MDSNLQDAVTQLEQLTAEFKATNFATEEERQQALQQLKDTDCFKIVEKFVG